MIRLAKSGLVWFVAGSIVCGPVAAIEEGSPAPSTTLPTLAGQESVELASLQGRVVLVDFWASWCAPCRKSLPLYESLYATLSDQAFSLVAINLDEYPEDAVAFLEQYPVSYTVLSDPQGRSAAEWSVPAMPSSYLLDTEGHVVKAWAGFNDDHYEELRHEIQNILP